MDPGLPRREGPRRRQADAAHLHADPDDPGPRDVAVRLVLEEGLEARSAATPWPAVPSRGCRGHAPRDVPRQVSSPTPYPASRPARRSRPRPSSPTCAQTTAFSSATDSTSRRATTLRIGHMGITGEPPSTSCLPLRDRDDAPRAGLPERGRRGRGRCPGTFADSVADRHSRDFPRSLEGSGPRAREEARRRRGFSERAALTQ